MRPLAWLPSLAVAALLAAACTPVFALRKPIVTPASQPHDELFRAAVAVLLDEGHLVGRDALSPEAGIVVADARALFQRSCAQPLNPNPPPANIKCVVTEHVEVQVRGARDVRVLVAWQFGGKPSALDADPEWVEQQEKRARKLAEKIIAAASPTP